jgi:hypothetical protein
MREYPDRGGRLPYRLWYAETEIEDICRRELELTGWPLLGDGPAIDVDTFVERRLGLAPDFVWLPRDVLGATEFGAKGEVHVQVSAELALRAEREPSAERLLRSTLAHEAAHVLLHRSLFLRESRSLFSGLTTRTELCRSVGIPAAGYTGEWWEWQANRGMAALLLPAASLSAWLAERTNAPSPAAAALDPRSAASHSASVASAARDSRSPASAAVDPRSRVAPARDSRSAASAALDSRSPAAASPQPASRVAAGRRRLSVPAGGFRVSPALRDAAAEAFGVSADAIKRRLAQMQALARLEAEGARA